LNRNDGRRDTRKRIGVQKNNKGWSLAIEKTMAARVKELMVDGRSRRMAVRVNEVVVDGRSQRVPEIGRCK